ncbi:MAG: hypothetical protein LQ348_003100 [Seirophora lacunosa]|nr:MAG: hypothetical protein LQ348_003100 [Seirophora lacunosa]
MRVPTFVTACATLFGAAALADPKPSEALSSQQILPDNFKPPQVFQNTNLVRHTNLEKGYLRETVNVVIENIDSKSQDQYYFPFGAGVVDKVGGLEVTDKKNPGRPFKTELVEYDPYRQVVGPNGPLNSPPSPTQFFRITLPQPLPPKSQLTLSITYHIRSTLTPLPLKINQQDKQYLLHTFSIYTPSAYPTLKQKTKIKFPTTDIPDVTGGSPDRLGSTFTYGPYNDPVPAGALEPASVRYEFTRPLIHATLLERDIEVSQWGGNLACEERYWLTNQGAQLSGHFDRVQWAATQYYSPPTSALRALNVPLRAGALNPYFTDDIGNVSTSRFRSGGGGKEANLELKPRYPVFGGWKYSFRIGWDADLRHFLRRRLQTPEGGGGHVLKVPFLEGPRMGEGVSYAKVEVRVILPEGARNVRFETEVPLVGVEETLHRTFMDTVGRTTVKLTAMNVVDEARDKPLIVTYDYPFSAAFRKPITIFLGVMAVFITAWGIGRLDVSIAKQT